MSIGRGWNVEEQQDEEYKKIAEDLLKGFLTEIFDTKHQGIRGRRKDNEKM